MPCIAKVAVAEGGVEPLPPGPTARRTADGRILIALPDGQRLLVEPSVAMRIASDRRFADSLRREAMGSLGLIVRRKAGNAE